MDASAASSGSQQTPVNAANDLLSAFRIHYHQFQLAVTEALNEDTDTTVVERLGDDLDEFTALVNEVCIPCTVQKRSN